jgi:hypothetical protein
LGQLLIEKQRGFVVGSNIYEIDISNLTSGSYNIQIEDQKTVGNKIFVVE